MNQVVIGAFLSLFILGLGDNVRGPLYPEILKQYDLSNSLGAWFFALSSLGGACSAAFTPLMVSILGQARTLAFSLFVFSGGFFVFYTGLSAWLLFATSFFVGGAMGTMGVLQNTMISQEVGIDQRSRVLSGLHAMYGLSSFIAPLIVALLAMLMFSWQSSFLFVSVGSFLAAVYVFFRVKTQSESSLTKSSSRAIQASQIWLALALSVYVLAEVMISTRLALYYREIHQASLETSSYMVTLFFVFLLLGRLVATAMKVQERLRSLICLLLLLSALSCLLGLYFYPLFLPLSGLFMSAIYPLTVNWLSQVFSQKISQTMSLVTALQSFGLFVMHLGIGQLTDLVGLKTALLIGTSAFIFSALMIGSYGKVLFSHPSRV